MARYSRRIGPAGDFELIASRVLVPGMFVQRHYGRGALLICGHVQIVNGSAVGIEAVLEILLDGVAVGPETMAHDLVAGADGMMAFSFLEPVSPGLHRIELFASGVADVGDVVWRRGSSLVVVELPKWDQDNDLITL